MTKQFTPEQLRAKANTFTIVHGYIQVADMLRQAADDAEFRRSLELSGETPTRTPKEQTK